MEHLFVPSKILLESTKRGAKGKLHRMMRKVCRRSGKKSKMMPVPRLSGFQLLFTCKQACAEGHAVFYSSNAFFMPLGPRNNMQHALELLQPQHRAMIRCVGITMGLQDLTPAMFQDIHHAMEVHYGNTITIRPTLTQAIQWRKLVEKQLRGIWMEKVNFLVDHMHCKMFLVRVVKIVKVDGLDRSFAVDLTETVESMEEEDEASLWSQQARSVWQLALRLVREDFEELVKNQGWKAMRDMVKKGAFKIGD